MGVSGAVAMSNTRFEITVTDPVRVPDGKLTSYISYKVNKRFEDFVNPVVSVVRRYKDFVWLHDQLWKECSPGVIVPALPDKLLVGRFDEVRIEMRRRALQNFLMRVAAHPKLECCQAFKAFLEGDAEDFLRSKQTTADSFQKGFCTQATSAASSMQCMFSPFRKQMRVRDENDDKVDDIKQYICNFDRDLNAFYKQTSCFIKRNKDLSTVLTKFGSGCERVSKADGEDLDSMSQLAKCASMLAASTDEAAHKEIVYFEQPIGFYTHMIGPIQRAITVRDEKGQEYERALKEFTSKKQLHAKVDGEDGKEENACTAAIEVDQAQAKLDEAKEMFYETTETLLNDFERFRQDKLNDFKKLVADYTQLQIDFAGASQTAWKEVMLGDATNS